MTCHRSATGQRWGLCLLLTLLAACRPQTPPPQLDPRVVSALNQGVGLMGQYDYEGAARAFEEAVTLAPSLADARVNWSMALFNRGRREDADRSVALLDEVLARDPNHLRALYFKGIILQHLGQAERAVECFARVTQTRPDDGAAWYLLGLCQQRLGQPATEALLHAIQRRPHLYSAYYQLYQTELRAGRDEAAARYLEQFRTLRESPLGESIELPQYNQMGDLALVQPPPGRPRPPLSSRRYEPGPARLLGLLPPGASAAAEGLSGLSVGDVNDDQRLDLLLPAGPAGVLLWLQTEPPGTFTLATNAPALAHLDGAQACSLGDVDHDQRPDLCVVGPAHSVLLLGTTHGVFAPVQPAAAFGAPLGPARCAVFVDADHDGDLDLFLGGTGGREPGRGGNALWNNNGDGTFTNLAAGTLWADARLGTVQALPADLDGDRDADLVLLQRDHPARWVRNRLLGRYDHAVTEWTGARGDLGGVVQDFNGDALPDLAVLGGTPAALALFAGDGQGGFTPSAPIASLAQTLASWGPLLAVRAADLDLDGDLDLACFGARQGHALLNDGSGRFVARTRLWQTPAQPGWAAIELVDVTDDGVPDLLAVEQGTPPRLTLSAGTLSPPSPPLRVQPTGLRSRDQRTRSPASGFGVRLVARQGLHEQTLLYSGLQGGPSQSIAPAILGLPHARTVDYLQLQWPDGVMQVETALAAGPIHRLPETQRKISSCPVLFAWNGQRFAFITDFAGVGGLGYYVAPGESAPPQVLEHVKIEPGQLRERDQAYELRITEPMEESAYLDRLELLAVDHPSAWAVFPDERLALSGPPPTHALLAIPERIFPIEARDPEGHDATERVRHVDRLYAYEPPLDRRYLGFCRPHTLELDFGDRLASVQPAEPVYLFLNGFIEYPYSQTVYAAAQSRIGWEPIRIDRLDPDGHWRTIVPDGGAPGGMARTFTIDLTGLITGPACRLRLTTNLEIFLDQVFVGRPTNASRVTTRALPLAQAELRRAGFAREFSPDGRLPWIYDYEGTEPSAPFHVLRGAYTRYGPVHELLRDFDDRYVVMGPGDELAVSFAAATLPPVPPGETRSFILVSHAYCKDMDLYTATPQTLEPLPFRGMSQYPYPETEPIPETPALRDYRTRYQTRRME